MEFHEIVAKNIKAYRKKYKMSLEKLSQQTGVSTSALSEIEKGNTIPSINTVWKITNGLKISFSSLMSEEQASYQLINKAEVTPITEEDGKYKVYPYFPFDQDKSFEFFQVCLEKGAKLDSEPHLAGSEEYVIVIEGQMELIIDHDHVILEEGDAVRFKSDVPHYYKQRGPKTTQIAMVIYYQNQ